MPGDAFSTGQLQCQGCPVINRTIPQLSVFFQFINSVHSALVNTLLHHSPTNSCKQFAFFHVYLVQTASVHRVRFLLSLCLMAYLASLSLTSLSLLRTVNKQAKCWNYA